MNRQYRLSTLMSFDADENYPRISFSEPEEEIETESDSISWDDNDDEDIDNTAKHPYRGEYRRSRHDEVLYVFVHDPNSHPDDEKIIYLNENKTSYLKINHLPQSLTEFGALNFEEMFNLHPKNKHSIIMYKEEVEVNRWQQSYLKTPPITDDILNKRSYMYSGFDTTNNNIELPEQFQIYYDYVKSIDNRYNQVVVNWYQDQNDYIAYHADCETGMIENAEILMISLYPTINHKLKNYGDDHRSFSIIPKCKKTSCLYDEVCIQARHGTMITMCGDTQKDFKHSIKKEYHEVSPRISISFRQFN